MSANVDKPKSSNLEDIEFVLDDGAKVSAFDFISSFLKTLNKNEFVGLVVVTSPTLDEAGKFKLMGNVASEKNAAEILFRVGLDMKANLGNNKLEHKQTNDFGKTLHLVSSDVTIA